MNNNFLEKRKKLLELYQNLGWTIIPVRVFMEKDDQGNQKRFKKPLCKFSEYFEYPPSSEQIEDWFEKKIFYGKQLSILDEELYAGLLTGKTSGMTVLDFDPRHGGDSSILNGIETMQSRTPSGGLHFFFLYNERLKQAQGGFKDFPGVDVRNNHGFVVLPSGYGDYEWINPPDSHFTRLASIPAFLIDKQTARSNGEKDFEIKDYPALLNGDQTVTVGDRHKWLRDATWKLLNTYNPQDKDLPFFFEAVIALNARMKPPKDRDAILQQFNYSVHRWRKREIKNVETPIDAAETASQEFQFTPLSTLLNEPEEKINWVVDGLLPSGGFSILVAKPKVGKSTLARQLVFCVTRGEPFLGRQTVKGRVLYVSLEEKRYEVRNHFKLMGANGTEDLGVYVGSTPEGAYKWLENEIKRQPPILVIIDTLFRFARVSDVNDYAKIIAALDPLLALARNHFTHIIGTHHARKSPGDGADATLGSTAIFGSVDTAIVLKRTESKRTIETQQRYGIDMEPTLLLFDTEYKIATLGGTKEEEDIQKVESAITEFLKSSDEPVSESVIDDEVEGRTIFKRKALRKLVSGGGVMRTGLGKRGDPFLYSCFLVPTIYTEQESEKSEKSEIVNNTSNLSRSADFEGSSNFGNEKMPSPPK